MRTAFRLVLGAALLLPVARAARAASGLSPELQVQRVQLERSLEERVKSALVDVAGTPVVVPVVNVRLVVEDVKLAKDDKVKHAGVEYVLPGVPVDQQLTKNRDKAAAPQEIRRADRIVNATIFVGKSLDAAKAARVKDIASQVLEIDPGQGDSLEVKLFDAGAPPPAKTNVLVTAAIAASAAFVLLAVVLIVFLAVFPNKMAAMLQTLGDAVVKAMNAATGLMSERGGAAAAGPTSGGTVGADAGGAPKAASDEEALFGFINEENVQGLVQALARENEVLVTSVLECLPRPLAAQAFALFPPEKRRDIVLHSRAVKYGNPEAIRSIERQIRSKLGFSFGGVRRMARIIQRTGHNVRNAIIGDVAKVDPDLAKHLRDNITEFEDVLQLDDRSFGRVARELSIPSLARFLKTSPPEWVDRVASKLNPELAALLKEQVEFTAAVTPEAADEEFARIVEIVDRLKAAGLIQTKNAQPARP